GRRIRFEALTTTPAREPAAEVLDRLVAQPLLQDLGILSPAARSAPPLERHAAPMMAIGERFPNLRGRRAWRAHFALSRLAKRANRAPVSEPAANRRSAA